MSFINKELLKATKKKIDDSIELNGLLEMFDGLVISFALDYISENYSDKIPVEYQDEIILLLEAFVEGDLNKLTDASVGAIDELVNLPFANESDTAKFIAINVKMLKDFIVYLSNK